MTIPTNEDLRALGYKITPDYVEGMPYPSGFVLTTPDGKRFESVLDTNLYAVARQHARKAMLK